MTPRKSVGPLVKLLNNRLLWIRRQSVEVAREHDSLNEVLVSAQKREERLNEVPLPVTVCDTEDLHRNESLCQQDFFASLPGLYAPVSEPGTLVIRGISTTPANPTVGVFIDETPDFARQIPEFDSAELARVEVLRGPQGTLYGASAFGGLIRYVVRLPALNDDRFPAADDVEPCEVVISAEKVLIPEMIVIPRQTVVCSGWELLSGEVPYTHARDPPEYHRLSSELSPLVLM
jgi:hypothetical protein